MPARRLILVAQAATPATRRGTFPDGSESLEPAGLAAVEALAALLPHVARSFASPAASATATSCALGLHAITEPSLRDLDVGAWARRAPADLPPDQLTAWLSDPDWAGHGGESLAALIARAHLFLDARLAEDGTTLAVTHAALIRAALVAALAAPASAFWRIDVAPLHACVLGGDGRRWALRALGPLASVLRASGG